MSEKPRKIEWVKYTGKPPYMCNGYLIVKIDSKETTFGGEYVGHWKTDYPKFWDCGKFDNPYMDWDFWRFEEDYSKDFKGLSAEEKRILEKLWKENAPEEECWGCVND